MNRIMPNYEWYLTKAETCPFYSALWQDKLSILMLDLSWIDTLKREDIKRVDEYRARNPDWKQTKSPLAQYTNFCRDVPSDCFPRFEDWPTEWKDAQNECINAAAEKIREHVQTFEKFTLGEDTLYINKDVKEVYCSSLAFPSGAIYKMNAIDDRFDSAIEAADNYLEHYRELLEKNCDTVI